ncbi:MAG: hypothetical protein AB1588_21065 [Pseudomonadota bacterium]
MTLYFVSLLIALALGYAGCEIELKYYESLLSVMIGASGAIFTIMGIWIANLYPGIIVALRDPQVIAADFSAGNKDTRRLNTIIGVIITSALNMCFSIILLIMLSVQGGFGFSAQELIMLIMQPAMLMTSLTQLFAIVSVIYVCSDLVSDIRSTKTSRKHDLDS